MRCACSDKFSSAQHFKRIGYCGVSLPSAASPQSGIMPSERAAQVTGLLQLLKSRSHDLGFLEKYDNVSGAHSAVLAALEALENHPVGWEAMMQR